MLSGWSFVILRPRASVIRLVEEIQALGGSAEILPMIEIMSHPLSPKVLSQATAFLHTTQGVIVTSQHAVAKAPLPIIEALKRNREASVLSMGQTTTEALMAKGITVTWTAPPGSQSETLLDLPLFQTPGSVALLKGEGGRQIFWEALHQAKRLEIIVYRRVPLKVALQALLKVWQRQKCAFLVTSHTILQQWLAQTPVVWHPWVKVQPVVVISPRLKRLAEEEGFQRLFLAQSGRPEAVLHTFQRVVEERL